jgi:hypothetical protein
VVRSQQAQGHEEVAVQTLLAALAAYGVLQEEETGQIVASEPGDPEVRAVAVGANHGPLLASLNCFA